MSADIPQGDVMDNDYKSRTGQSHIPVQGDEKPVEDPIDPATADSDEQLGKLFLQICGKRRLTSYSQGRR